MCLTTVQNSFYEFKACDHDLNFDSGFAADQFEGPLLAIDDGRSFSNISNFSAIAFKEVSSDTTFNAAFVADDVRSFSSVSNFSESIFETLIGDTTFTEVFAADDGRSFSNVSNFSESIFESLIGDTTFTEAFAADDGRSFSNVSNFSAITFDSLVSDPAVITTRKAQEDNIIRSSHETFEDHVTSMVTFLEATRQKAFKVHSLTTKVRWQWSRCIIQYSNLTD
jgi:hypothetical protein